MSKNIKGKMNTNEKRWIVLLIAVLLIAIVLIVGLGMNKEKNNAQEIQQGQTQEKTDDTKNGETTKEETYTTKLEDGTRLNTSEELKATKRYKDLEISNIQFTEKNGMSVLLADVKNIGSSTHEKETVKITITGEDGNKTEVKALIGEIKAGETKKLNTSITANKVNASNFEIEAIQ